MEALGIRVFGASVDAEDKALEVAEKTGIPVAYGVTREQADAIGAFWEDRRSIVQPSEFLIDAEGRVAHATYSAGPIGRVLVGDVLKLVRSRDSRK